MKPRAPSCREPQAELFRTELVQLINLSHPLAGLARVVEWGRFDEAFTPLYDPGNGRPANATRPMVGLHYLKHLYQLSDEEVVEQWVEESVLAVSVREQVFRARGAHPSIHPSIQPR